MLPPDQVACQIYVKYDLLSVILKRVKQKKLKEALEEYGKLEAKVWFKVKAGTEKREVQKPVFSVGSTNQGGIPLEGGIKPII